jgi:hypothetical protein
MADKTAQHSAVTQSNYLPELDHVRRRSGCDESVGRTSIRPGGPTDTCSDWRLKL